MGDKIPPMDIASQLYILWYDCDTFSWMVQRLGCTFFSSFSAIYHGYCDRIDMSSLHLIVFFFQLLFTYIATALTHHCCIFFSSFQLCTTDTAMELTHHNCIFFSSSSLSSSSNVCMVTLFILINLCSSGSSCPKYY